MKTIEVGDILEDHKRRWLVADRDGSEIVLKKLGGKKELRLPAKQVLLSSRYKKTEPSSFVQLEDIRLLETLNSAQCAAIEFWYPQITEVLEGKQRSVTAFDLTGEFTKYADVPLLRDRVMMKAREMQAAFLDGSERTIWRKIAAYRKYGLIGLADGRQTRRSTAHGRTDPAVVDILAKNLNERTEKSTITRQLAINITKIQAREQGLPVPSDRTLYRLIDKLDEGESTFGLATTRRSKKRRPKHAWDSKVVLQPGEIVEMDSTPLDVLILMPDGSTGKVELSIAIDIATRSITGAIISPTSKSVDLALLLARSMTSHRNQPGWEQMVDMARRDLPQGLIPSKDRVNKLVEETPVIIPQSVTTDRGKNYTSKAMVRACEKLGISMTLAAPYSPTDKPHVESAFKAIRTGFVQMLPGYTGNMVAHRGKNPEEEASLTLDQLTVLFDLWVMQSWQNRSMKALRHRVAPKKKLSPNDMFAILEKVYPQPMVEFEQADFIEFLPSEYRVIRHSRINFQSLIYSSEELLGLGIPLSKGEGIGKWEIRYDPYWMNQIFVRDHNSPTRRWITVPSIMSEIEEPFSETLARLAVQRVKRKGDEVTSANIADELVKLMAGKGLTKREKRSLNQQKARESTSLRSVTRPEPDDTELDAYDASESFDNHDDFPEVLPLAEEDL